MIQVVGVVGNRFVLVACLHDKPVVVQVVQGIQYYCCCCNWLLIHSLVLADR